MALFKPNVEKLKARKDIRGLMRVLNHKNLAVRAAAVEALRQMVELLVETLNDSDWAVRSETALALGLTKDQRAIQPLIGALKDKHDGVRYDAAKALVEIGKRAIPSLIQALKEDCSRAADALDNLGWQSSNDEEKAWYLLAKYKYDELLKLGKPAEEPIIRILSYRNRERRKKAAEALGQIGDLLAAEPIIDSLYDYFFDVETGETACIFFTSEADVQSWSSSLVNLFSDYTDIIARSLLFQCETKEWHMIESDNAMIRGKTGLAYNYDLFEAHKAIEMLCGIFTKISSNLLIKISQLKDPTLKSVFNFAAFTTPTEYSVLTLDPLRRIAEEELMRRCNPPYDPSAYIVRDAWKL